MKKKVIIFIFIICFLFNINTVYAKSTYTCTAEVAPDEYIECKVNIDDEPVMIESDGNINIFGITGNKYSKLNSAKALFYESGTIKFGPANDKYSKYIISLYTEDGLQKYDNDFRVSVIKKTTTTTATTTTKKKSSNNYLTDIKINNETIKDFSKNKNRYYITYSYEIEKVIIEPTLEDETANLEIIGPDKLEVGDNEYTIGITSEDNTTRYYKILITRKEKEKELSSDTKLSDIKIDGYEFNFNRNSKTYHLKIKENVKKLNINVKPNDQNSQVKVIDNEELKDGSEIKIIVTAEDGSIDTYRIIITKEKNKSIIPFIIIGGLLITLAIIVVIIIILSKKKRINKHDKIEEEPKTDEHLDKTIEFGTLNNDTKILEEEKTVVFTNDEKSED